MIDLYVIKSNDDEYFKTAGVVDNTTFGPGPTKAILYRDITTASAIIDGHRRHLKLLIKGDLPHNILQSYQRSYTKWSNAKVMKLDIVGLIDT